MADRSKGVYLTSNVNLNNLCVFQCVYETRRMTDASKILQLTQSGVSQHIRALEKSLGVDLFDRINKRIIPTDSGHRLYDSIKPVLKQIQESIDDVTGATGYPGDVRMGTPFQFGNGVILPLVSSFEKEFPETTFKIMFGSSSRLERYLLDGRLDFAFVDTYSNFDSKIKLTPVAEEVIYLCALKSYVDSRKINPVMKKSYFETLEYVAYEEDALILRRWFSHHLKRRNLKLNVRVSVPQAQGVSNLIMRGVGVGILPHYLAEDLIKKGHKLHIFGSEFPENQLKNKISVAMLKKKKISEKAQNILDRITRVLTQS